MIATPRSFYSPTNLNARAQKSFAGCDYWHCDFAPQVSTAVPVLTGEPLENNDFVR